MNTGSEVQLQNQQAISKNGADSSGMDLFVCCRCGQSKPREEFYSRGDAKNKGVSYYCKSCDALKNKAWHANNREKINVRKRHHYQQNKTAIVKRQAQYRQENNEYWKMRSKQWAAENKEKRREGYNRRRARKLGNGTFVISAKDLKKLNNSPCYICGGRSEHIDHIVPLSRGGSHGIGNLAACCAKDNIRKSNLFLAEYLHNRIPLLRQLEDGDEIYEVQ
jgi:5-methylcytosine-specific restriction endonuclease McrA